MSVIIGLDLETTGIDPEKHRIIEVGMVACNIATRKVVGKYVKRIHPERSIPADAQAIHGISLLDVTSCLPFKDHAGEITAFMARGNVLLGHNLIGFDAPFLAIELQRAGYSPPNMQLFDTMTESRWATPNGKLPTLGELCYAFGLTYDSTKAHGAEYDILKTLQAFFRGLDAKVFRLPENIVQEPASVA